MAEKSLRDAEQRSSILIAENGQQTAEMLDQALSVAREDFALLEKRIGGLRDQIRDLTLAAQEEVNAHRVRCEKAVSYALEIVSEFSGIKDAKPPQIPKSPDTPKDVETHHIPHTEFNPPVTTTLTPIDLEELEEKVVRPFGAPREKGNGQR